MCSDNLEMFSGEVAHTVSVYSVPRPPLDEMKTSSKLAPLSLVSFALWHLIAVVIFESCIVLGLNSQSSLATLLPSLLFLLGGFFIQPLLDGFFVELDWFRLVSPLWIWLFKSLSSAHIQLFYHLKNFRIGHAQCKNLIMLCLSQYV